MAIEQGPPNTRFGLNGGGGIRTRGPLARTLVFKTSAFIVPRAGLVIVAAVPVLLVVAIAVNREWPLVFLHVAVGAGWTIIDLFLGLVLGPIMGRMPSQRGSSSRLG